MRLRYASLFVVLTACASVTPPAPAPKPPAQDTSTVPSSSTSSSQASASDAASSATAATDVTQGAMTFDQWRQGFVAKAASKGFDPVFVSQVLSNVQPQASVTSADSQQPEFSKPISTYIRQAVSPARGQAAAARLGANPNVPEIEKTYGVPSAILGGIWTMESDMGRVQGNTDVITALATLAWEGRRRALFEDQLIAALTILRDHNIQRTTLKGSWAGAMGQTQFMPDSYLTLGVDGDHDGKVDIWNSDSDALASSANLLAKAGWKPDEEWAVEVVLPVGFDYYLSETTKKTPLEWQALGLKRADGGYWKPSETGEQATLLLPSGAKGPAYLALPNHYIIRKYNNSTAYALAVGFLADAINGKGASVTPWPVEQGLSKDQRYKSQQALKAAGYDPGTIDGVIGFGTRQAIRDWQRANRLTADGYLSTELANRFVAMVDGTASPTP